MTKIAKLEDNAQLQAHSAISQRDRYVAEIIDFVRPTHFITLSLLQGRRIFTDDGFGTWVRGDDVIYAEAHRSFVRSLSKKVSSKWRWKKHKNFLRSAGVIEGGSNLERNHLHIMISLPAELNEFKLRRLICQTAENCSWIMTGDYSVDFQQIRNLNDVAYYCTKNGISRVNFT